MTALVMPNDLQEEPYVPPPRKHGTVHFGIGYSNAGKRVAILVGSDALGATDAAHEALPWHHIRLRELWNGYLNRPRHAPEMPPPGVFL